MKCPFTGKPCLLPKEVFVTEVNGDVTTNLYLCRKCGDEYIKQLDNNNSNTKVSSSVEIISSDSGVVREEIPIDNDLKLSEIKLNESQSKPTKTLLIPQIKKIEAKLQDAIDKENYEDAAKLRDILDLLRREQTNQEGS